MAPCGRGGITRGPAAGRRCKLIPPDSSRLLGHRVDQRGADAPALAVKDGTVWAWGYNMNGELGNGEISTLGGKSYAVQVADLYVESPSVRDAVNVTPAPTTVSGFNFNTMGTLGCLLVIVGLLSGFARGNPDESCPYAIGDTQSFFLN